MTRIGLSRDDFNAWCDQVVELINGHPERCDGDEPAYVGLRAEGLALFEAHVRNRPDGHRSNSLGGGSPSNELDEEIDEDGNVRKVPMPPRSDPTGRIVVARVDAPAGDLLFDALETIVRTVWNSKRDLEVAQSKAARTRPPVPVDPPGWCKSCLRKDPDTNQPTSHELVYEKAKSSGLCRWCYDQWLATGEWPPVEACAIRARVGAQAAGRWLARRASAPSRPRRQKSRKKSR